MESNANILIKPYVQIDWELSGSLFRILSATVPHKERYEGSINPPIHRSFLILLPLHPHQSLFLKLMTMVIYKWCPKPAKQQMTFPRPTAPTQRTCMLGGKPSVWFGLQSFFFFSMGGWWLVNSEGTDLQFLCLLTHATASKVDPPIVISQSTFGFLFGLNLATLYLHLYLYSSLSASRSLWGCIRLQGAGVRFLIQSLWC